LCFDLPKLIPYSYYTKHNGMTNLKIIEWRFCTEYPGQPIGPIFKQSIELIDLCRWDRLVVPKIRYKTAIKCCVQFWKSAGLIYTAAEF